MKATELRIDNWVIFEGQFHTITNIRRAGEVSVRLNDGHFPSVKTGVTKISPIPIKDWKFTDKQLSALLRIGIEVHRSLVYLMYMEHAISGECIQHIEHVQHIEYVHQIQNLYHALTGEDL